MTPNHTPREDLACATRRVLPRYRGIAQYLEDSIITGEIPDDALAPSARVLARQHNANIVTATRALGVLEQREIVRHLPGIGKHILAGERNRLIRHRRDRFTSDFLEPMIEESRRIGLSDETLTMLIRRSQLKCRPEHGSDGCAGSFAGDRGRSGSR